MTALPPLFPTRSTLAACSGPPVPETPAIGTTRCGAPTGRDALPSTNGERVARNARRPNLAVSREPGWRLLDVGRGDELVEVRLESDLDASILRASVGGVGARHGVELPVSRGR